MANKHGGKRPGAGNKKGNKTKKTLKQEEALKLLQQQIIKNLTPITVAAINSAIGERFMFKIEKDSKGNNKTAELVTGSREIEKVLQEIGDDSGVVDDIYYYISTKPSNTNAIKELFDRAFGKAPQSMDITTKGKELPTPIYGGVSKHNSDKKDI